MQDTGHKEGLREGRNVHKECADIQHCICDPFLNIKTLVIEEHEKDAEVVYSKK